MRYTAIKEYTDTPERPIALSKGEALTLVEESDPHGDWPSWAYCKGVDKEGWVPKQILAITNDGVAALEDYIATEHSLVPGDILVSEKTLNGWIWGYKENDPGNRGWAPINHLQKV